MNPEERRQIRSNAWHVRHIVRALRRATPDERIRYVTHHRAAVILHGSRPLELEAIRTFVEESQLAGRRPRFLAFVTENFPEGFPPES